MELVLSWHNVIQEDSIVIRRSATVYEQLIQSECLWSTHKLTPEKVGCTIQLAVDYKEAYFCHSGSKWAILG